MKNDLVKALVEGVAPWKEIEFRTEEFWIFKDAYPVTEGHLLFVPTTLEPGCLWPCFKAAYKWGYEGVELGRWDGFNIGQNVGEVAGQTVMYPHIHMIPRRKGDMDDPRGGVRHVIPEKGNYRKKTQESGQTP
jgi:diadenosine tetraphosphate (Ap4A) HIT family hydrolase